MYVPSVCGVDICVNTEAGSLYHVSSFMALCLIFKTESLTKTEAHHFSQVQLSLPPPPNTMVVGLCHCAWFYMGAGDPNSSSLPSTESSPQPQPPALHSLTEDGMAGSIRTLSRVLL